MTYSIRPAEVRAVLTEVGDQAAQYEGHIASFEGNFQALITAAKNAPALSATLLEFTERVLMPQMSTITGRTDDAITAVGNAVVIVETADAQMADDARTAQIQAAQSTAGGSYAPAVYGGTSRGAAVAQA